MSENTAKENDLPVRGGVDSAPHAAPAGDTAWEMRQRMFTRRALLGAGLALPIVLAVGGHSAQASGFPHTDSHSDHSDHADHSDHSDHSDSHSDHADHSDHGDHGDTPHIDQTYPGPHTDHTDNSQQPHGDSWNVHNDGSGFGDTHNDTSHADSHTDMPHSDSGGPHGDHGDHGDHSDHYDDPRIV